MGEGEGGMIWENNIETCISSRVKQITSPSWMHETSARGWFTGMTPRDGMRGEVEGGFRMGTHVNPWLSHVNVWQKPQQYCKVISLQLIKIIGEKKEIWYLMWSPLLSYYLALVKLLILFQLWFSQVKMRNVESVKVSFSLNIYILKHEIITLQY